MNFARRLSRWRLPHLHKPWEPIGYGWDQPPATTLALVHCVTDIVKRHTQVASPLPSMVTNLYSKLVPDGKVMVTNHSGLLVVYWLADIAMPAEASQLPSCAIEPTR